MELTFVDKLKKSARDLGLALLPVIAAAVYDFFASNPLAGTKWAAFGAFAMVVADAIRRQWFPPAPPATFK